MKNNNSIKGLVLFRVLLLVVNVFIAIGWVIYEARDPAWSSFFHGWISGWASAACVMTISAICVALSSVKETK